MGHSRLLAEGTKEEEKREEDVAVLGLGGRREGTTESGQVAGQTACPELSCSWQLLPARRSRPCWPPEYGIWERPRALRSGTFRPLPQAVAQLPGIFLMDCYLSYALLVVPSRSDVMQDSLAGENLAENFNSNLLMKVSFF